MTEQEWLARDDPVPMLEFVASPTNDRKLRLFLCACCARVLESAAQRRDLHRRGRSVCMGMIESALRTIERFADGFCGTRALETARRYTEEAVYVPSYIDYGGESGLDSEALAVRGAAERLLTPESVIGACRQALATLRKHRGGSTPQTAGASLDALAEPQRDMASWLRDVVGNPFRPVKVDAAWLSPGGSVVRVAESIYASGSFAELPILADALEDAGCADADILGHCRGRGPHIRGCWAVDLFIEAPRRFALAAASPEPEEESRPAAVEPSPSAPARPPLRPGDWLCPVCNALNFARRDACLRCQRARPRPQLREGDWICPGCNAHNFARRQSCHQCKSARPS